VKECKETRKICKALKAKGALVFAVVGGPMQEPGWPDRYVAHWKWSGWLEFKTPTGRLTPLQKQRLDALRTRGVPAFVVRLPNRIEQPDGTLVATFDDLLETLCTS
jgi:hypothetical protein